MKKIYYKKYFKGFLKIDFIFFKELENSSLHFRLHNNLLFNFHHSLHNEMEDILLDEMYKHNRVIFSL